MSKSTLSVCILGLNYSPEHTGNAPYTASLAEGLAARGHDLSVVTAHPHYPEWKVHEGFGGWSTRETQGGVSLTRLSHYVPAKPQGLRRLLSELTFGLRLIGHRLGKPAAVVLVSPALFSSTLALARLRLFHRSTLTSIWVQDLYSLGISETGEGGRLSKGVITCVEKWTFRHVDAVAVIHDRFKDHVVQNLGVDASRVTVLPNWSHLEPAAFERNSVRAHLGWGPDETIVLHAGNMGVKQGLENVVQAAKLAGETGASIRFVLMGDGSQRTALEAMAGDLANLSFVSPLPDGEFQAALGSADILLVNEKPGVSDMAVPSKLTSYFSTGLPVLAATDPQSITAQVLQETSAGNVVKSGDPRTLLDGAVALREDQAAATRLGLAGRKHWEQTLGADKALDRFETWLRGLASTPS